MFERTQRLLELRPIISSAMVYDTMSFDERFQNVSLRPIVKLQNDLLIIVFKNYVSKHKNVFYDLTIQKKMDYIENAVQKDMKFRNSLKGIIIGQFTVEEYELYMENSSALNKRMINIVKERLIDHVQLMMPQVA